MTKTSYYLLFLLGVALGASGRLTSWPMVERNFEGGAIVGLAVAATLSTALDLLGRIPDARGG